MKLRTKIAAVAVAGGATLGLMGAPVAADGHSNGGYGYGKTIQEECGASYGQLVSAGKKAAKDGNHPMFTPSGAKGFVEGPVFSVHCPGGED